MPPILRIQLFGGFDLSYGNTPLTGVTSERLQSLLAYLVLNRQKAQARQQLAFLFWADSPDAQARTNLRRVIHELRQVLPTVEEFIAIDTKTLQWRLDAPFTLDVMEFEQAVVVDTVASLQRAADLYRGKLLPNCYDEWIEPEQERLQQTCIQVYTRLMQLLLDQQDYRNAIRYGQQLLRLDPLNETGYFDLMRSYALSGDRANALQTYHRCMTILCDELGIDPSPATRNLYESLLNETDDALTPQHREEIQVPNSIIVQRSETEVHNQIDWGEATDVSLFYGRTEELEQLEQWIQRDHCRVITLLGMGGIGKTSLSVKLAQQLSSAFSLMIWRSLRNSPPLEALLTELVSFLSHEQDTEPSLNRLLHWLRQSRCLVILDNLETILQDSRQYRAGYEAYGELFRAVGEAAHSSCIVLTSREKPIEMVALEGRELPVRSFLLHGSPEAAIALIQSKGLWGTEQAQHQLGQFYGYNPLALKMVATSIQDLFDGDIAAFLAQDTAIVNNIHRLLEQQCQRCTPTEKIVMYWLAINREWTTVQELMEDITPKISRAELLEALEALRWRSLIEKQSGSYVQQPMVMKYVIKQFLEQVLDEIINQEIIERNPLIHTHTFVKTRSSESIQEIQNQEILQPILHNLLNYFGNSVHTEEFIKSTLKQLQTQLPLHPSYAGGNLLNLLRFLTSTLEDMDLSQLALWQVDLRNLTLYHCNLAHTDLSHALLPEPYNLPLDAVPFKGTNIVGIKGFTDEQRTIFLQLGAIEQSTAEPSSQKVEDLSAEIRYSVQQMSAATREVLNWAAMLGNQFDPTQLAELSDYSLTTLLTVMEELEQNQMIHPSELVTGEIGYAFTQAQFRQFIYDQISEPRRRLMQQHIIKRFPNASGTLA